MVRTDSTKSSKYSTVLGFVLLFSLSSLSWGAEIGGGISVGASRTDNVFLATSPDEIDDIVYQASPFFNFLHESPQLDANVRYTFDWYRYADLDTTSKYHRGEASLTSRVWQNSLTTTIGIRRRQTLNDPDDVIPPGNMPLSGNLIDQDELWFNPNLNRRLGGTIALNAGYTYSKVRFNNTMAQGNVNQLANLAVDNYSIGRGLTWALRYNWRRTDYDVSAPWEYQQAMGELGFWVNASTRVFGSGGKESAWDNPFDPALTDPFWEAGFAYSPNENLTAEFAVGERSFGSSWRGRLDYTFRRGSTSLSYNETPTTTGYNRSGGARSTLDPDDLDEFLDRPGNAERFISSRLQWMLNLTFRRAGFDLSVFDEDRTGRISAEGVPGEDQSQTGVTANFAWQAGVRTEFVIFGSIINRETGSMSRSRYAGAGLNVNYRLGTRSSVSLGYRYDEQEPRGEVATSRDYVANVVSLFYKYSM